MEELCDDETDDVGDGITVATVPVNVKIQPFKKEYNVMSSPALKKRKPTQSEHLPVFQHNTQCLCKLCGNILLFRQQCQLAFLTAEHLEVCKCDF